MRVLTCFNLFLSLAPASFASIPSHNGVLQTHTAIEAALNTKDPKSLLSQCENQGLGTRYFTNHCTKLVDLLRKRMNTLALDSDLQIQAEKISTTKLTAQAKARIKVLTSINVLSIQAEDAIMGAQASAKNETKSELADIVAIIKKVQTSVIRYSKLL